MLRGDETTLERVEAAIDRVCGDEFYCMDRIPNEGPVEEQLVIYHDGKVYLLSIREVENSGG